MLPYDFEYFKPASVQEAISLYQTLKFAGKTPKYFSGGTEIITLGRINLVYTDAVIDLKGIPEYTEVNTSTEQTLLGAGLSLVQLEESNPFPLLSKTVREIADHTARTKITLGGNICAEIYYREAVLPFLLADSVMVIANIDGIKVSPIHQVFQENLLLHEGGFLLQTITKQSFIEAPHISIKRRRQWNTGYPLITVAALKVDRYIRVAISGLAPYPFRAFEMEKVLNNQQLTMEEKVNEAIEYVPSTILNDTEGSSAYRIFVLRNTLFDILEELGKE
ncbi:FAD binding domain-containing protein [Heyndrickxia ginsengihumi]|uniref:Xanthine dehydrogenase n=1 Tax=Heyndrickxia ginsengihumi TaxID=363870 RepID=A0A0A6VEB8_9BACI|nr:FAD binding domain-containing protein [Heyndrickxia ginsengihumi]KHD85926.1 xanthine dehydrogenase [Heyndrickxia ginsengihumi]MBE6185301.1 xanthine dehydrogenase [Bacillus sp. (in: firmicutes)]MCM3023809.1 FAD binding domain-containing protein [Heyndrickxia ginsengihumi]NEY19931.1 xanthine dehydrogenase [Heyndrickxia ginsengihumi]